MKAFVTGATGFLGSHLVDLLLSEGHDVTCLVRRSSNLRWLQNKKVQCVEGDLFPENAGLRGGLQDADWCFHVAGLISSPDPQKYYQVNAGGTRHCLDACLRAAPNLKRFVLVSSIAASGPSPNGKSMDETMTPNPSTEYGKSKLEAEKIALSYQSKLPISIIRPPAIYGPRDTMIFPVFKMARKGFFVVPSDKKILITMAYVEDVAGACFWAAQSERANGETYFIADGDSYRWHDIADTLANIFYRKVRKIPVFKSIMWPIAFAEEKRAQLFGKKPRLHRGQIRQFFRSWCFNIDKIKKAGFTPKFNLESGMKTTVAGYRQMGWL